MIPNATPAIASEYFPQLDELIENVKNSADDDHRPILLEHLQTAYAYLRGAMPEESSFNLELAQQAAWDLPDQSLKRELNELVDRLKERLQHSSGATR